MLSDKPIDCLNAELTHWLIKSLLGINQGPCKVNDVNLVAIALRLLGQCKYLLFFFSHK